MRVAVLGAGVVGVTTAHYLAGAGHDITVIDQAHAPAQACSYANGAQLSYSYTDAMAGPSFLLKLPGLILGADAAIRVRPPLDGNLVRWGVDFLAQCKRAKAAANTLFSLELAVRSAQLLRELRNELPADFHYREAGKFILLRTARELDDARRISDLKAELGVRTSVVSIPEAIAIEPAIEHLPGPYAGAVYSPGDDVGDAREFTLQLAERLDKTGGARFQFGTKATGLVTENNTIHAVRTADGDVEADAVVVCLGAWSPDFLRPLGVRVRILPARGYSVTLPPGRSMPAASVTDFGRRFVITRLGEKARIAGFADFVGFSSSGDEARIRQLLATAQEAAPEAANYDHPENHAWAGGRPLTPDGRPLVGPTAVHGLYLNTGHGSLGWTLACATAEKLASEVKRQASRVPRTQPGASAQPRSAGRGKQPAI